ncbi:MAG: hypothetical protein P8N56_05435 [Schleiferiaceae bacterium]|nr:hypothetical protein [Schleiferiaceae bacterium]
MKKLVLSILALAFATAGFAQSMAPSDLEQMKFRNIGPAGMSGRVTSIDVNPLNDNHIYVGTASGGVWMSENAGQSWTSIWDDQPTAGIGAVKIDPTNPDIIWVGTGEGNPRNSQSSGGGLFKSVDGGKSFQLVGLKETKHIHRIVVDHRNPNTVYVAAIGVAWGDSPHRGVYKTTDGGKTWSKVLYNNERTGAADLVMDPVNPNKLICAMWEYRRWPWVFKSGGEGSGMYVTLDGGETWTKRTSEDGLPEGDLGRMGIAIAPSNPKKVYALVENKAKNGLYGSNDGGFKWFKISEDENIGNRPFYYSDLFVDPFSDQTLYSLWTLVSKSTDGGKTWDITTPYSKVHPDHHAIWLNPRRPGHVIEGNDGGLNISWDAGASWRFVENLPVAQFYHIRVDNQLPYNVYGGMQDNGSWRGPAYSWIGTGIGNNEWQELYFGDGFDVLPHPSNSRISYAMAQEGSLARIDMLTGMTESIKPVHPEGEWLRWHWNAAIAGDPSNADGLYYGSQYVHHSPDQGRTWTIISPDLTTNNPDKQKALESGGLTFDVTGAENHTCILTIAPSPKNPQTLWVGTDDGNIQVSKDGGATWTNCSPKIKGLPEGAWVPHIHASAYDAGEAFVVVNNYRQNDWNAYLFHTKDYGKTWTNLVAKAEMTGHALSVIQDNEVRSILYLGTETGLQLSTDYGKTWQAWKGLPTMPVQDLAIQEREQDLILGTFGRSAWVLDDLRPLRAMVKGASTGRNLTSFDAPLAIHAETRVSDGIRFQGWADFKGENRGGGARFALYLRRESDGKDPLIIDIYNAQGEPVRHMERKLDKEDIGLYRYTWDMAEKGSRRPRWGKPNEEREKSDPRGASVAPGVYLAVFTLGENIDSASVTVVDDPRINMAAAEWDAQISFQRSLYAINQEMSDAVSALYEANQGLSGLERILKDRMEASEDSAKVGAIMEDLKALKKDIEAHRLRLFGKEDVKGYFEQPETWASVNGQFGGYLWSLHGKPSANTLNMQATWEKRTQEEINLITQFLETAYREFVERIESTALPLLPRWAP